MSDLLKKLEALGEYTSPTIIDALAQNGVDSTQGFTHGNLKCHFPSQAPVAAIAFTVEIETLNPNVEKPGPGPLFIELLHQIQSTDYPVAVVAQEVGVSGSYAAHCGEVLASSLKAVGAKAVITDGAIRDYSKLKDLGMHFFSRGIAASNARARTVRINSKVEVEGLVVNHGDILHLDANGVVSVPQEKIDEVLTAAKKISESETGLINYINSKSYTFEGLIERLPGGQG